MIGSIPYVTRFVLGLEAESVTLIMAGLLLGMFISMPIWAKIADKIDNDRKTMIIAAFALTIMTGLLFFVNDYMTLLFAMFIWGTCEGGYWVMMDPVRSNAIDESVLLTKRRKEGIYQGFQTFVSRAALVGQAVSFSTVHTLTGFVEGSDTQTPEAIRGIQIHYAVIPMIFMLIASIILWRFYKLTPPIVKANKEKLIEMGI